MFYLFSLIFFMLGILSRKTMIPFLIVVLIFPFGNAFSLYFYKSGLYSYDFFFIGFILSQLVFATYSKRIVLSHINVLIYVVLFVYFIFAIYNLDWDLYLFRDLRLVLYITYVAVFLAITIEFKSNIISERTILLLILVAALSNIIYLSLSLLGYFSFSDNFYSENSFRYFDVSTYVCSIFVIFYNFSRKRLSNIVFILACLCVLISGIRVLILLTFLLFIFRRVNSILSIFKIFSIIIIFIILTPFFPGLSDDAVLINRITNLSVDTIYLQITVRYSPFFELLDSFAWYNYFIGKGIGTTFFIPWFEYRDAKDALNNFIDSTYVTLYSKLGVLFIIYIAGAIITMLKIASFNNRKDKIVFIIFSLSLMIVYSLPYQASSIGIIIGLYLIKFNEKISEERVK